MESTSHSLPASTQRTARLEARLSLYAQYAALLGEEMAAAWSAEPARAAELTRELARARSALAEQYDELRGSSAESATLAPEEFGGLFVEAVTELEHQQALDEALRARAGSLRPDGIAALPAPRSAASDVREAPIEDDQVDGVAQLGGALVVARSSGVGGVLGGQYPGVATGAAPALSNAAVYTVESNADEAPAAGQRRLDVRF